MINSKECKSNFYNTPYLAEYYDLWSKTYADSLDMWGDVRIYLSALWNQLVSRGSGLLAVLDVGTGIRCVLVNLAHDVV